MTKIDHITVTAPSLQIGADFVTKSLGFTPQKGGEHHRMGTHNLFLRLGDSTFLEVIACNPNAQKPNHPRWFALDEINDETLPQVKTWVVRTNDIDSILEKSSETLGEVEPMSRGDNNWLITIPKDGSIPLDGGAPALIQWEMMEHPASKLEDFGLSLSKLQIFHPEQERIIKLLDSIGLKERIEIHPSKITKLVAHIDTPDGVRTVSL